MSIIILDNSTLHYIVHFLFKFINVLSNYLYFHIHHFFREFSFFSYSSINFYESPLFDAIHENSLEIVDSLVQHGADINMILILFLITSIIVLWYFISFHIYHCFTGFYLIFYLSLVYYILFIFVYIIVLFYSFYFRIYHCFITFFLFSYPSLLCSILLI